MTDRVNHSEDRRRQWRLAVAATALLACVLASLWSLDHFGLNRPALESTTGQRLPVVSVVEVAPATHKASIVSLSEARARHAAVLRTQSAGQIVALNDEFLPGQSVRRGSVLLRIQDDQQKTMVAEAENRLAQAKLALLIEERTAATAAINWRLSAEGEAPPSPLVLREPQLSAARAEHQAAAATLDEAIAQLDNTAVRAPFDGVIELRDVSLGETVDVGSAIGTIVDRDTIDVTVHLDRIDWSLLPDALESLDVSLRDPVSGEKWPAIVRARSGIVDESTRLRRLYVVHRRDPNGNEPLLPGTFVQVSIPGRAVDDTLQLPESALTRNGAIWTVDADNRLARHDVAHVFSRDGSVFVSSPSSDTGALRVAVNPLAGFIAGERVDPRSIQTVE